MKYSVIIPEDIHAALYEHLIRDDGQEDLCFATYVPSNGKNRQSAILSKIIFPLAGERNVHYNVGFLPNYLERVVGIAKERKEGVVFLHSHPAPGWQGMSNDDVVAEERLSPTVMGVTNLPLLGLTLGTDETWSGRFWTKHVTQKRKYERQWCESVRVLGKRLSVSYNDNLLFANFDSKKQLRTISAWGNKTQEDLSRLRIGIVGVGSVGSIVAEILARTGISNFTLIDFDTVEEKNLDRLTNIYNHDIGRAKVQAAADGIRRSATSPNININCIEYSICEKEGFLAALDCDILFCCVDRPWPRQVLNFIAYAHMIPVIDGGIMVRTNLKNTTIKGADWKAQTVGYKRACLECLGQFKTENANLEKHGYLDDPNYIVGLSREEGADVHENVFVFSSHLASLEVLQMLSLFIAPSGIADVGQQMHHFVLGTMDVDKSKHCDENCFFQSILGRGDFSNVTVWGSHQIAEQFRQNRNQVTEKIEVAEHPQGSNAFSKIIKLVLVWFNWRKKIE